MVVPGVLAGTVLGVVEAMTGKQHDWAAIAIAMVLGGVGAWVMFAVWHMGR